MRKCIKNEERKEDQNLEITSFFENIFVNKVHTMPTDYPEMLDLSPGGYQRLSQAIEADETVAVNFLE